MKDEIQMLRNELINWMIGKIISSVDIRTSMSIDSLMIAQKISADFNAKLEQEISDAATKLLPENSNIIYVSIIPISYEEILNDKLPIDLYQYLYYQSIDLKQIIEIMQCENLYNNDILAYIEQNKFQSLEDIPYISDIISFIYNYNYLQYLKHLKDGKPQPIPNKSPNAYAPDIPDIPDTPDTPNTPDILDTPDTSDTPDTPDTSEPLDIKPTFDPDSILDFYKIHIGFFNEEDRTLLLKLLETGDDLAARILFKSNGNRLTDSFKKMIEHNLITGCQKIDLQTWISNNFSFLYRNTIKLFTEDYIEKCISRDYYPCQSPLIEIVNGKIQKFDPSNIRKRNNH